MFIVEMIKVLRRLGHTVLGIEPIAADHAEFGSGTGLVSMSGAFHARRMPGWLDHGLYQSESPQPFCETQTSNARSGHFCNRVLGAVENFRSPAHRFSLGLWLG